MDGTPAWLAEAVSAFGVACKDKLEPGIGQAEAAIRTPIDNLLSMIGTNIGVPAHFIDEVADEERQVRPDYGVTVGGATVGYVEVKAPGKSIAPTSFTGHDKVQWERQKDLPNLVYTNGTDWRLYRDGNLVDGLLSFGGSLYTAGKELAPCKGFEALTSIFHGDGWLARSGSSAAGWA